MSKCLCLLHGWTMFFFQVQRSKPSQLIDSLLWQHKFLLRTDFTFHVLWQCVPYSPLLTTSSDPVLFCVLLRSNCRLKWRSLSLPSVEARDERGTQGDTRWPLQTEGATGSLAPCFSTRQIPPTMMQTRGSEKAALCSRLALIGSLNNWKCLCPSLCTLLKLIYVPALLPLSSAAPPTDSLSASLCWSWDIPSIFWHLRVNIIEL